MLSYLVAALGAQGLDVGVLSDLPLRALTRMTITSRYPIEATPPSELFESSDAVQAIDTAGAVIGLLEQLDQPAP